MKLFEVYPLYDVTPVRAKDVLMCMMNMVQNTLDLYTEGMQLFQLDIPTQHYVERIKQQSSKQIGLLQSNCNSKPVTNKSRQMR